MNKRTPFVPYRLPSSTVGGVDGPPEKTAALREAYKRHSSELVTIDEQQVKLLLVVLGIFSAGATFLASGKGDSRQPNVVVQVGLTVITLALIWVWVWFSLERHNYRQAVRDLLLRCELALGFYAKGAYLDGINLYADDELEFPSKGGFMLGTNLVIVVLAGLGFILVLWSREILALIHCSRL